MTEHPLVVLESHPVQYHAPVYRAVQAMGVPVHVIYGSDFSVAGYRDAEFGAAVSWGTGLLDGYESTVLHSARAGSAASAEAVRGEGLRQAVKSARPGAILVTGYTSRYDRAAIAAGLVSRRPLLFRAETTDHALVRSAVRSWGRDVVLRPFYGRAARCLYIGTHSRNHYLRLGVPENRLVRSPYCVDTTPFETDEAARERLRVQTRNSLDIPADRPVLLFSGKLSHRKGVDLLVDAARLISARQPLTVLFLGDGEERAALAARAACEPTVDVRFAGFKGQQDMSPYFHAADALVLPSRFSETWGLVVNEALHHGLPAIISDGVGSAPDLVVPGETGEIVESDSAAALAGGIERWLGWRRESVEARERCRAQVASYTVEEAARGIAAAYGSVLSAGS